jgi:predicted permease
MWGSWIDRIVAMALGLATYAQGLMLVHLGRLSGKSALQVLLVSAVAGLVVHQAWTYRRLVSHRVDMILVMLAFGGLGMILGWWIDFGFGPAVVHGGPKPLLASLFSWMTGLMLVGAVPPAFVLTRCARLARGDRRRWISTHVVGNLAMIACMIAGGRLLGPALTAATGSFAVGHHAGMVVGMVLGMFAGMWLGELALGLRPWRRIDVAPVTFG